jgi:hypothetical protein
MTRRRSRVHHPAAVIAVVAAALVAADAAAWLLWLLWHLMSYLLALSVAGGLAWVLVRHRRPLPPPRPKVIRGHAEDSEVARLRAEVETLRHCLAETTDAMHGPAAFWRPGGLSPCTTSAHRRRVPASARTQMPRVAPVGAGCRRAPGPPCGHAGRRSPAPRTPKPRIRWRTRTVANASTGIPCWEWSGGLAVLAPPQTQNPTALTCQVAEVDPSAASEFQATARDGTTTLFTVGTP